MANKKLVEYFENNIKKGYTETEIRQILLKAGIKEKDIGDAVNEVNKESEEEEKSHIYSIVAAVVIGVLLSIIFYFISKLGITYFEFVTNIDKIVIPIINNVLAPVVIIAIVVLGYYLRQDYSIARWNATMMSLFLPGAGQAAYKQVKKAVLIWIFTAFIIIELFVFSKTRLFNLSFVYFGIIVLVPLYIWNVYDAYRLGSRIQEKYVTV